MSTDELVPEPEYRGDEHEHHPRLELLYKAWGLLRAAKDEDQPIGWHLAVEDWLRDVRVLLVDQPGGED